MERLKAKKVLFLTGGDPWGQPVGGQSAFAKNLLKAFRDRLAIASYCDDDDIPVSRWVNRSFDGRDVNFFNRGASIRKKGRKPLVPARVSSYLNLTKWMGDIRSLRVKNLLLDSPESIFASENYDWDSVCYSFAGVNNPVLISRYRWLRIFGNIFERQMIKSLIKINPAAMIAAADQQAIDKFVERTGNALGRDKLYQFPTRVDMDQFYPIAKEEVRRELCLSDDAKILVTVGRLCWIKGWELLLASLNTLKQWLPDIRLVFVGDGEDRVKLKEQVHKLGLVDSVQITGLVSPSLVLKYINAADVCVVGSYREGWSVAMLEIIACGKALVSTDVSGVRDIISLGRNGYVVSSRDPVAYAKAVRRALELDQADEISLQIAKKYSVQNLAKELGAIWNPLA